jgi:hypothetical protein
MCQASHNLKAKLQDSSLKANADAEQYMDFVKTLKAMVDSLT